MQRTYAVLSCLNQEHQVTHVASSWSYNAPLSFYLLAHPAPMQIDEKFDPRQTQVYVKDMLHTPEDLAAYDHKIFYRSPTTDAVLAASPPLAATLASGPCVVNPTQ